jgi:hypothetical protein
MSRAVVARGLSDKDAQALAVDIKKYLGAGHRTAWTDGVVVAEGVGDATNVDRVRAFVAGWLAARNRS